jgi:hypothetical protein
MENFASCQEVSIFWWGSGVMTSETSFLDYHYDDSFLGHSLCYTYCLSF